MTQRFDAAYYQRFYANRRTRVIDKTEMERRASLIAAVVADLEVPVKRILDAGCGLGWMRRPLLKAWPKATYVGVEVSEHLCEKLGWVHSSVTDYRSAKPFDLIICNDVMQYLTDREAAGVIANFGRMCRGALFLHVPTRGDWATNADHSVSDTAEYLRDVEWYRARLNKRFRHVGLGVWLRRDIPLVQWELHQPHR